MKKARLSKVEAKPLWRLDIGCGKNKKPGFTGVDQYKMDGVDVVHDVRKKWPWGDNSVEEVHCSHFLEHLEQQERVMFMNELYRVLIPAGKATLITPHWCSNRAYGDPTHKWPAVSEMFFYYLSKEWRDTQAPHTDKKWDKDGFECDFQATWGYSSHPELVSRNQEYQMHAFKFWKEAAQDIIATLVKK